jgi:hypothetical protein
LIGFDNLAPWMFPSLSRKTFGAYEDRPWIKA